MSNDWMLTWLHSGALGASPAPHVEGHGWHASGSEPLDGSNMQTLGNVPGRCGGIQVSSGKSDMAVRTQEVERGLGDPGARELPVVGGIARYRMDAQPIAERRQPVRRRRLPDHDQIESRVVEFSEQVLGGTVRLEPEPQPRKPIAGARRGVRQARPAFPITGCRGSGYRSGRWCETRAFVSRPGSSPTP